MTTSTATSAATTWAFLAMPLEDTLKHLKGAPFAIAFALKMLPDHEVGPFLREWQEHKDLKPWLDALEYDRLATTGS